MWNRTLIGFIKKEFQQMFRNPGMLVLLFVTPMIQLTLFGLALSNDVKNIRLSAHYHQSDTVAQHIYERALASGYFVPANTTVSDPYEQLKQRQTDAVLISPPKGLSRSIYRKEGELQLLLDATNVTQAQTIENYIRTIVQNTVKQEFNQTADSSPIQLKMRILYNASMRTPSFMVPGVMGMIICITPILLTAMAITKEKEDGTFEMLIASGASAVEIILGKTIPYIVLGMSNMPFVLAVSVWGFDVPMRGALWVLALTIFIFICVTVALGTLISTICQTQQQSMMSGFLFLFPAILLSGLMFPLENMPIYMKGIAYLNPLTYFLDLLRNIMLKGGEWGVIMKNWGILVTMALVFIGVSFKRFKTTLG